MLHTGPLSGATHLKLKPGLTNPRLAQDYLNLFLVGGTQL